MTPRVVLGGTFDPIHRGHLHAARAARGILGVPAVTLLPAARPGHRQAPAASALQRWRMVCLAVRGEPGLEASDLEIGRAGPSYTVDTLAALGGGRRPLIWCIGRDALDAIADWHRAAELPSLCHLLAFERPGSAAACRRRLPPIGFEPVACAGALADRTSGRIHYADAAMLDISATGVRQAVAAGDDAGALLPGEVWAYIRRHGLYGAPGRAG